MREAVNNRMEFKFQKADCDTDCRNPSQYPFKPLAVSVLHKGSMICGQFNPVVRVSVFEFAHLTWMKVLSRPVTGSWVMDSCLSSRRSPPPTGQRSPSAGLHEAGAAAGGQGG